MVVVLQCLLFTGGSTIHRLKTSQSGFLDELIRPCAAIALLCSCQNAMALDTCGNTESDSLCGFEAEYGYWAERLEHFDLQEDW